MCPEEYWREADSCYSWSSLGIAVHKSPPVSFLLQTPAITRYKPWKEYTDGGPEKKSRLVWWANLCVHFPTVLRLNTLQVTIWKERWEGRPVSQESLNYIVLYFMFQKWPTEPRGKTATSHSKVAPPTSSAFPWRPPKPHKHPFPQQNSLHLTFMFFLDVHGCARTEWKEKNVKVCLRNDT